MKIILELDQDNYETYLNAPKYESVLWECMRRLRELRKYQEGTPQELIDFEQFMFQLLNENNIDL